MAGLIQVLSNADLDAKDAAAAEAKQAAEAQQRPVVVNLAGFVRRCFDASMTARQPHEQDMFRALRMRNGEYDPEILSAIKQQGGSEVYMRLGATKMRGAQSWLKDIYLNIERPWTIDPTPVPALKDDIAPLVEQQVNMLAMAAQVHQIPVNPAEVDTLREKLTDKARAEVLERAREMAERAANKVDDILVEGGFYKALDECLTDITTFKVCVMKGPVIRMKRRVKWADSVDPTTGKPTREAKVETIPLPTFVRVSPLAYYPAPNAVSVADGYTIQRHKLFRSDLVELLNTPGFDNAAIRGVLNEHGTGGLRNWLSVDSQEMAVLHQGAISHDTGTSPTIDALEYWGGIQGKTLLEWGMDATAIPDPLLEYPVNVWVIGQWVIKAMLNADPLARTPFSVTSLVKIPGTVWGEGLGEQLRDVSQMCNASARSLANNMAIASGPMVGVDASRLPVGESITSLHPWKIFQFMRDMIGGGGKPIEFFQPQSNAAELQGVFEKFSTLADEYSNIPRYMLGDNAVGGAGRTAAGLSMLMNAANKGIKNVANNIDTDLIVPTIERLYNHLMLNDPAPEIKGDLQIRARGASGLMLKELLNQRRLEFMQQVPVLSQMGIVKPEGIAAVAREIIKGLEMPQDKIIPSDDEIRQIQVMRAEAEAAQQEEEDDVQFNYDHQGKMQGATVRSKQPRVNDKRKPSAAKTQDQNLRSLTTGPKPH